MWQAPLDVILAWAEDEDNIAEVPDDDDMPEEVQRVPKKDALTGKVFYVPSAKDPMAKAKVSRALTLSWHPRLALTLSLALQYLVKWQGFGYRALAWVPHAFLVAAYPAKLSNFLAKGSPIAFEVAPVGDEAEDGEEEAKVAISSAPMPDPTAEERIPKSWKTPERVLLAYYTNPGGAHKPPVTWDKFKGMPEDPEESIKLVVECYFKWGDLPYGACESASTSSLPTDGADPLDAHAQRLMSRLSSPTRKATPTTSRRTRPTLSPTRTR